MFKVLGVLILIAAAIAATMIACGYSWTRSITTSGVALLLAGAAFVGLLIYGGDR